MFNQILEITSMVAPFILWLWHNYRRIYQTELLQPSVSNGDGLTPLESRLAVMMSSGVYIAILLQAWTVSVSVVLLFCSLFWLALTMAMVDRIGVQAECFAVAAALNLLLFWLELGQANRSTLMSSLRGSRLVLLVALWILDVIIRRRNPSSELEEDRPLLEPYRSPYDDLGDGQSPSSSWRSFWRLGRGVCHTFIPYIRPRSALQYRNLCATIFSLVVIRIIRVIQPLYLRSLISQLNNHEFPTYPLIIYVVLQLSDGAARGAETDYSRRFQERCESDLNGSCYSHILRLSADYHVAKSSPETMSIMEKGGPIMKLLYDMAFDVIPQVLDVIITLPVIGNLFGAEICFVILTTVILSFWSATRSAASTNSGYRIHLQYWQPRYTRSAEAFANWRMVKEASAEDVEIEKYRKASSPIVTSYEAILRGQNILHQWQNLFEGLGFMMSCYSVVMSILQNERDVGAFYLIVTYWFRSLSPIQTLTYRISDVSRVFVEAEELMITLAKTPSVPHLGKVVLNNPIHTIEFDRVSFAYPGKSMLLQDICFRVTSGEMVYIVGASGSGKSTIFGLMLRLFDPVSGRILVNGHDLRDLDIASLHRQIGSLPQDSTFWDDTILENLTYPSSGPLTAEIIDVCKVLNLQKTIDQHPEKYQQRIGESGRMVSGGERRRFALAKVLLKKCSLRLLDEPTSALDTVTEQRIQGCIRDATLPMSTIVISHRLLITQHADCILVMDQGKIVESGKHEELLARSNGTYSKLWKAQNDDMCLT